MPREGRTVQPGNAGMVVPVQQVVGEEIAEDLAAAVLAPDQVVPTIAIEDLPATKAWTTTDRAISTAPPTPTLATAGTWRSITRLSLGIMGIAC